jgi:hypothetical protein
MKMIRSPLMRGSLFKLILRFKVVSNFGNDCMMHFPQYDVDSVTFA